MMPRFSNSFSSVFHGHIQKIDKLFFIETKEILKMNIMQSRSLNIITRVNSSKTLDLSSKSVRLLLVMMVMMMIHI